MAALMVVEGAAMAAKLPVAKPTRVEQTQGAGWAHVLWLAAYWARAELRRLHLASPESSERPVARRPEQSRGRS